MIVIWFLCLGSAALHSSVDAGALLGSQCPAKKPPSYLNTINNVEQIPLGVHVNTEVERGQQKRYTITVNHSTPLLITIVAHPPNLVKRLYFNQTINLSRHIKMGSSEIFLPCATSGQFDLILNSRRKSSVTIEATDKHPAANWSFLNRSIPIRIRYQNRMQKRQMVVKWNKSKLDIHAVHYCLVINTNAPQQDFCQAVQDSLNSSFVRSSCMPYTSVENIWLGHGERIKKIDSKTTNVVCTGSKARQILRGLLPNIKYFIDIFGVHTKLRNLTFLLKSTTAWFNRTRPNAIVDNSLTIGKIPGMTSVCVFSYKIPLHTTKILKNLRFLIIPCGGSQVDLKILKQRQKISLEKDIYKPSYVTLPNVSPGERYILRVSPSNDDEILRANRVAIAATTQGQFPGFPEFPDNTTIFEIRSFRNCRSATIAWYASPDTRRFRYCIVVFTVPNYTKKLIDHTNYCMEFGKKVTSHPQFYRIECYESKKRHDIEHFTLLNLTSGGSYLIYVTINLLGGRSIPYQSLNINVNKYCHNDLDLSWKNSSFYDN